MERLGLCRFANQSAFHHAARAYDAVKVSSRSARYLLPVGNRIRHASPKVGGGKLLPPLFALGGVRLGVVDALLLQVVARNLRQLGDALDTDHAAGEFGEQRRL